MGVGAVTKVAVHLALGITLTGQKEVSGMWVANSDSHPRGSQLHRRTPKTEIGTTDFADDTDEK